MQIEFSSCILPSLLITTASVLLLLSFNPAYLLYASNILSDSVREATSAKNNVSKNAKA